MLDHWELQSWPLLWVAQDFLVEVLPVVEGTQVWLSQPLAAQLAWCPPSVCLLLTLTPLLLQSYPTLHWGQTLGTPPAAELSWGVPWFLPRKTLRRTAEF